MEDYPVKVYCPLRDTSELVYFHPVQVDGEWYVDKNRFNGCDHNWNKCQECDDCKEIAYKELFKTE